MKAILTYQTGNIAGRAGNDAPGTSQKKVDQHKKGFQTYSPLSIRIAAFIVVLSPSTEHQNFA